MIGPPASYKGETVVATCTNCGRNANVTPRSFRDGPGHCLGCKRQVEWWYWGDDLPVVVV